MRFAAHVLIGLLVGMLFWFIGNDANAILSNAGLLFFNQLFILFTSLTPTVITCTYMRSMRYLFLLN
jgi:ATP-binding cassette subfamily G (WHITE) protein 1